jgi:APA family basic amino acid/polyamine antiporter
MPSGYLLDRLHPRVLNGPRRAVHPRVFPEPLSAAEASGSRVARLSPRFGTPVLTTAVITVVVAALAGFVSLGVLADLVSIGTLFAFVVVSVAVPILRRTRPELRRTFRVPLSPWLPGLSALACLYLMSNLSIETWLRFLAWLALGLVVYVGYGRRNARLAGAPDAYPDDGTPSSTRAASRPTS